MRAAGGDEIPHGKVLRELKTVAHVSLSPAEDGRVHGNRQGSVACREGPFYELRRDHTVLLCTRGRVEVGIPHTTKRTWVWQGMFKGG